MRLSRKAFLASLASAAVVPAVCRAGASSADPTRLDFTIEGDFGGASHADVLAVIRSAAETIWRHCPATRWEGPGFHIYRSDADPITLNDRRPDGRIAIGLNVGGNYWAQFAFQFAHEFGHALAGHSNDARKLHIREPRPNHWLEESICETASLVALRAMAVTWKTDPPYPNWKSFAPKLASYAADRMQQVDRVPSFSDWFRANEVSLRENATQRSKNNIVAAQLLPIFEAMPAGWESLTAYNLAPPGPARSLRDQFTCWQKAAPSEQHVFIRKIAAVFGVA